MSLIPRPSVKKILVPRSVRRATNVVPSGRTVVRRTVRSATR